MLKDAFSFGLSDSESKVYIYFIRARRGNRRVKDSNWGKIT